MKDFTVILKRYFDTIDEILNAVESTEDGDVVKGGLLDASYFEFVTLTSESPELKDKFTPNLLVDSSVEEFEKKMKEMKNDFEGSEFDFEATFKKAMKITLDNFVSKIGSQLAPEKVEDLKKIVSQNF